MESSFGAKAGGLCLAALIAAQCAFAAPLESALDSKSVTLIHKIIRPESREPWFKDVLPKYVSAQSPPSEWFNLGQDGGVWTVQTARVELSQMTYAVLKSKAWGEGEAPLFAANPKSTAIWWDEFNDQHRGLWADWNGVAANQAKPNQFAQKARESLREAGWPNHSAFYSENEIIGVFVDGRYPVIVNPNLLDESVLFVPKTLSPSGAEIRIYHAAGGGGCLRRALRVLGAPGK